MCGRICVLRRLGSCGGACTPSQHRSQAPGGRAREALTGVPHLSRRSRLAECRAPSSSAASSTTHTQLLSRSRPAHSSRAHAPRAAPAALCLGGAVCVQLVWEPQQQARRTCCCLERPVPVHVPPGEAAGRQQSGQALDLGLSAGAAQGGGVHRRTPDTPARQPPTLQAVPFSRPTPSLLIPCCCCSGVHAHPNTSPATRLQLARLATRPPQLGATHPCPPVTALALCQPVPQQQPRRQVSPPAARQRAMTPRRATAPRRRQLCSHSPNSSCRPASACQHQQGPCSC